MTPADAAVIVDDRPLPSRRARGGTRPGPHALVVRAGWPRPRRPHAHARRGQERGAPWWPWRVPVHVVPPPPPPALAAARRSRGHLRRRKRNWPRVPRDPRRDGPRPGRGGAAWGCACARSFRSGPSAGASTAPTGSATWSRASRRTTSATRGALVLHGPAGGGGDPLTVASRACPTPPRGEHQHVDGARALGGVRLSVTRWFGVFIDANVGLMQWSDPTPFVYLAVGPQCRWGCDGAPVVGRVRARWPAPSRSTRPCGRRDPLRRAR